MRNTALVTLTICGMLLAACGRVDVTKKQQATMSEQEALDTLMEVPLHTGGRSLSGQSSSVSAEQLEDLLQELAASGQISAPSSSRNAVAGGLDLTQLNNIFALLQGGGVTSLMGLAQGLLNMNGGSISGAGGGLSGILQILQMAMPIIATIAPQFAPIITALTTILPLVTSLFSMFRRPKRTSDAAVLRFGNAV